MESNRIEYKECLTDSLEKEVVAFLNYKDGGVIYLGVDDAGKPVGIEECDSIQLKIKDRLRHNIRPSIMGLFDVVAAECEGKQIIKLTIAGGLEKPYHLKKYGMTERGCFIRIGSASEPMPQNVIESLFGQVTEQVSLNQAQGEAQVTEQVSKLLLSLENGALPTKNIMIKVGLKHRPSLIGAYIKPAMESDLIEMTQPDSPRSPTQKYRLTDKGKAVLNMLKAGAEDE